MIKNLPTSARDIRGAGSIPGSGRSPGVEHGSPFQCPCLEKPMDRRAWWAMVLRVGHDRSDLAAAWMVGVHIGISKPEAVVFPRSLSVSYTEMVGWGGGKGVLIKTLQLEIVDKLVKTSFRPLVVSPILGLGCSHMGLVSARPCL